MTTWDQPLWNHVRTATPGLAALMATLQATAVACDAALDLDTPTAGFDPATGWAAAGGILAGLRLATGIDPPPHPRVDTPPTPVAAAAVVDMLMRDAADHALTAAEQLRADLRVTTPPAATVPRAALRAVALASVDLADTYRQVFARPW